MLDFRINIFLIVCEYMNFIKVLEVLCIMQLVVLQYIKYLEKSYDIKFFEYEGKKIRFIKLGKIFYEIVIIMKYDE